MIIRDGLYRDIGSIIRECNESGMFTELLVLMILLLIEADIVEGLEVDEYMMQRRCELCTSKIIKHSPCAYYHVRS